MQTQFNTRIDVETAKKLDDHSEKTGRSKASIVDAALREYLDRATPRRDETTIEENITVNWTDQDIIGQSHHVDLGEFGEFWADTSKLAQVQGGRAVNVPGIRRYLPDDQDEAQEENIVLCVELEEVLTGEEAATLTAGEIFIRPWANFTF